MLEIRNDKLYVKGHLIGDEQKVIEHLDNSTKWIKTRNYFSKQEGETQ